MEMAPSGEQRLRERGDHRLDLGLVIRIHVRCMTPNVQIEGRATFGASRPNAGLGKTERSERDRGQAWLIAYSPQADIRLAILIYATSQA